MLIRLCIVCVRIYSRFANNTNYIGWLNTASVLYYYASTYTCNINACLKYIYDNNNCNNQNLTIVSSEMLYYTVTIGNHAENTYLADI